MTTELKINELKDESSLKNIKEIHSQTFWGQKKVTWKVKDKVIDAVKKYHQKIALELGVVVGLVAAVLLVAGAATFKDTDKLRWRPDVTTEVVGGGLIACIVGFALGYLTFKIVKCCGRPNLQREADLKKFITKVLHNIYDQGANAAVK